MHRCRQVLLTTLLLLFALAGFSSPPLVFIRQPDFLSASSESPVDLHVFSDSATSGRFTAFLQTDDGLLSFRSLPRTLS